MKNNKRFVIDEFFDNDDVLNSHIYIIDEIDGEVYSNSWTCFKKLCELCNQLNDENERLLEENNHLKSILGRLGEMLQFDVDNNIETYPKVLVEYLIDALKVIVKWE